jgi:hypothetical protein
MSDKLSAMLRQLGSAHLTQRRESSAQKRTLVSYEPDTRKVGPTASASTASLCPSNTFTHSRVSVSHTLHATSICMPSEYVGMRQSILMKLTESLG